MEYNFQNNYDQRIGQEFNNVLWQERLKKGINFNLPEEINFLVRWMKAGDVSEVYNIEQETFPSPWTRESFLYRLNERDYNVSLVGLVGRKLVAYAISYIVCDELHFSNLAVKMNYRRHKIGEILLSTSMQHSEEKNCRWVHLEVRRNNKSAIQLYQKFGFKIVGVRKDYYKEENEDALLMSKSI